MSRVRAGKGRQRQSANHSQIVFLNAEHASGAGRVSLSVVLVTRGRPEQAVRAVSSVLRCPGDFELIVVDQSPAACCWPADPRLRVLAGDGPGLSRGRNQGIRAANFDLVVCTDDDCTVSPTWLACLQRSWETRAGMLFGSVLGVPGHEARFASARSLWEKNRVEGIGACMALSRSAWERVGGFDVHLGAGAVFPAGEELDLALRVLACGFSVLERPAVEVEHHAAARPGLVEAYWRGTGAVFAKHVRCGRWPVLFVLLGLAARFARGDSPVARSLRASRWSRLRAFVRGWLAGWRHPVDRARVLFRA